MDNLLPIVEEIGRIKDGVELNRWELAEKIHDAYSEFSQYERGLTSGLCQRLKYTPANLYNYRNAWDLKQECSITGLSVSHFARLYGLAEKYLLSKDQVTEYLELAESESWSVAQLSKEVAQNHDEDTKEHYQKSIKRLISLIVNVLNDPENQMDDFLRANLYDVKNALAELG